jgi:pSer/pThr/pTyr-binding forkhead associated (FHA) protein
VKSSGTSIPIPAGKKEVIIGREDPVSGIFPEIDLDPHGGHDGGVGRKHARMFIQNEQLMVEDQDSVNGTFINKKKLNAFQPHLLNDGDEVRLGKIILTFHAN